MSAGRWSVFSRRPRLNRTPDRATLIIPASYNGFIPLLLGVWVCAWGVLEFALGWMILAVFRGTISSPVRPAAWLAPLFLIFTVAGVFLAWRLAWVLRGREIVEITPARLTVLRKPGLDGPEEFERSEIRDVHVGSLAGRIPYPSWGRRFVGKGDAFVTFQYRGEIHQLGRGLESGEAQEVADILRQAS